MTSIYRNDYGVGELTRAAIEKTGSRLLQIHRFDVDECVHIRRLMEIFAFEPNERIADIGCGVGELASMIKAVRPDLEFILINPSMSQLEMCGEEFEKLYGRAEEIPLYAGRVDAVMVTYVLGHVDLEKFVGECVRLQVVRVYVYDLFKTDSWCRLKEDLGYHERTIDSVRNAFKRGGFVSSSLHHANMIPCEIEKLLPRPDTLAGCVSAAMRFERNDL